LVTIPFPNLETGGCFSQMAFLRDVYCNSW
jgi:hypothetical protein